MLVYDANVSVWSTNRHAIGEYFAGGGCIGPQNRLEQGAFAAPAGPDHGNYLARQHLQINVVKHTIGTENMTERFNF